MATMFEESIKLARTRYGKHHVRLLGERAFLITIFRAFEMSAKKQNHPLMVVIDSEVDMEEVKQTLGSMDVFVEGYGGDVECVEDFAFLEHETENVAE